MQKQFVNIFLWAAGLFFTAWMFVTLKLHYDNLQILDKAIRFCDFGEWAHFGNFGSGVGYLPGTLTTFLTALPMKLYFSPYSAMAVIAIFHIVSCWLLLKLSSELFPEKSLTLLILIFYWLNPWRVEQAELYNPGFLFLFAVAHTFSSFKMSATRSFRWTFFHVINIGFCSQLHFSAMILAVASLILFFRKQIKVHWPAFVAGVGVYLLSLLPYFLALAQNPELRLTGHQSDTSYVGRNLLLVYPVLKALLYLFRYGSTYYGRHIFSEINFDYLNSENLRHGMRNLLTAIQWPLAMITLYFSVRWQSLFFKSSKGRTTGELWFSNYFVCLLSGAFVASALSPVEFNHWHLILCLPVITLAMTLKLNEWLTLRTESVRRWALVSFTFWFCLQNALAAAGSRSHSYKNNFSRDFFEYYEKSKSNR